MQWINVWNFLSVIVCFVFLYDGVTLREQTICSLLTYLRWVEMLLWMLRCVSLLKFVYIPYLNGAMFVCVHVLRFLSGKCTVYKLFGLCMVLVLVSLLWLQLSCSGDFSAVAHNERPLSQQQPPPPPCLSDSQLSAIDDSTWGPHKLALIIPFRERFEELLVFVPFMHTFLNKKKIRHKIFVINQVDHYRWGNCTAFVFWDLWWRCLCMSTVLFVQIHIFYLKKLNQFNAQEKFAINHFELFQVQSSVSH